MDDAHSPFSVLSTEYIDVYAATTVRQFWKHPATKNSEITRSKKTPSISQVYGVIGKIGPPWRSLTDSNGLSVDVRPSLAAALVGGGFPEQTKNHLRKKTMEQGSISPPPVGS
jgi:hypothetical protein